MNASSTGSLRTVTLSHASEVAAIPARAAPATHPKSVLSKLPAGGEVQSGGVTVGVWRRALEVDGHLEETLAVLKLGATQSRVWVHRLSSLLEAALGQLHDPEHPAQGALLEAASLVRQQVHPRAAGEVTAGTGRLLVWQARKVRDHIDSHITGPVLVADLCALVQRSQAHFSRSFKRTFGESPHSFVVRRRVELAAQCMLTTDASLSDIALRCGFTDQAHLSRHFRQAVGQTPAAWRRACRAQRDANEAPPMGRFAPFDCDPSLGTFTPNDVFARSN